ncbi:MAG TPA: alpha/beta hydrolase [Actinophytocola sp.]|uniref:alpha/beta fold hydrolase n=1 Tax=Actinophytocola sp. TaxID=1872138 RepID=UPI002DBEE335|nr:alpha/beta hydrolase [Actinophytocola sp.]HEU5472162.1 alpha/beta hydrolase [Actinophytocola sp.]
MKTSHAVVTAVGGALGVAATGAAIAITAARKRAAHDSHVEEPLGRLEPDRVSSVAADDGVVISVEEIDPPGTGRPDLTVVYVHGFALSRKCWHFQRRDLARLTSPRVRQVLFDLRCHGRSSRGAAASCTIDQLARDLGEVLRAVVPDGPIVLIGHSMGGMTIMALAEQDPDLFADRVCGVVLIATTAGEVGKRGLPRPLLSRYNPVTRSVGRLAGWRPGLVEYVRAAGGAITRRATRSLAFGPGQVSPSLVDFMVDMLGVTPVADLASFTDTFGTHDRYAALVGLKHAHVQVISGDRDLFTPFAHAERIVAELPDATLVRAAGAGHMVMLEQPDLVTDHLVMLLQQCAFGPGADRRRWWRRRS